MRPSALLPIVLLALTGCGGGPGDVAVVGDQSLTQERLLDYMTRAGPAEVRTHPFADAIAQGWLDLALVAEAAASGVSPQGLVGEALGPRLRTEHLQRLQNALAMARSPLTEEEIERAFEGDSLRIYQRVLVQVPDWQSPFQVRARRARADSILALARAGAPFDRLARELSEGPNAPNGGYLGVVTRREVSEQFRDSVWALDPGGVSPVLPIDQGFQVLRRPPFEEARNHLAAHVLRVAGAHADSLLADSLATAHALSLLPSTADRLRDVVTNPDSLAPDSEWLVRFDDGGVTAEVAWTWLAALPDASRLALARASDVDLEGVARSIARNELLYRMAGARGIDVSLEDLAEVRTEFTASTDSLFATFAGADASRRVALVDSIVGAVIEGSPTRLLPPGLAPVLRRRIPHVFDRNALVTVTRREPWEIDPVVEG